MSRSAIRRRSTYDLPHRRVRLSRWIFAVGLMVLIGCHAAPQIPLGLPAQHALENDHLLVLSDITLPKNNPLLKDLDGLRDEIATELNLPIQTKPVTVYLFKDQVRYAHFIRARYPLLEPRRAYFVATSKELAVYTFWGERIQEDLRHEYTHGVLHASLVDVPLWLDEGLAEYFEVTRQPRGMNREYAGRLATNLSEGWKPNLERLETITKVEDMHKPEYQEAWAWVHFMLHHNEDTRQVLIDYLHDLRTEEKPLLISKRLRQLMPTVDRRFAAHAASLSSGLVQVSGELDAPTAENAEASFE